jgi:chromate transport protein ChrA
MAGLVKQFLQPVVIIWIILIAMCVWQLIKKEYRWALINGCLVSFMFLFGSTPLSSRLIGT